MHYRRWDTCPCGWRGSLAITLAAPCECLIATAHANGYVLAGSGVKGGTVYGATDDFGFKAIDKPVHVYYLHATVPHLIGIDHTWLTYRYSGGDFRLTDVAGNVIKDLLA